MREKDYPIIIFTIYDLQLLNTYTNEKHFVRKIDKRCHDKYQNIPKCICILTGQDFFFNSRLMHGKYSYIS